MAEKRIKDQTKKIKQEMAVIHQSLLDKIVKNKSDIAILEQKIKALKADIKLAVKGVKP